jgi:c-di-GMP-binding flagellar brake protein YcgR
MPNPLKNVSSAGRPMDRKSARFNVRIPIQYRIKNNIDNVFKGAIATDLSSGGLLFETSSILSKNDTIEIKLLLPGHKQPMDLKAKVVRVSEYNGNYTVAVNFMDISASDKEKINMYYYKKELGGMKSPF